MIGNDVIDLAQSRKESNWKRKGFLEKLFTDEEQVFISNFSQPEVAVWLLWSMKESAYKIYNRQTKIRAFIPKQLVCVVDFSDVAKASGKVICNDNVYFTTNILSSEHIHTIAVDNLDNLDNIAEVENLKIVKDQYGIPYLQLASKKFQEISISHHGRFEKKVVIN